jgi:hypothetical protein
MFAAGQAHGALLALHVSGEAFIGCAALTEKWGRARACRAEIAMSVGWTGIPNETSGSARAFLPAASLHIRRTGNAFAPAVFVT